MSLDFSKMKSKNSEKKKNHLNNTGDDVTRFIIKKSSLDTRAGKIMGGTRNSSTYQGYSNESSPNREGIQKSIFGASAINFNQTSRGAFPGNINLANRQSTFSAEASNSKRYNTKGLKNERILRQLKGITS